MPKLYTYKASAGSGKTHQLASQYLRILFKDPCAYRNILAVTFTNKAAGEMKNRIIRDLFFISESKADSLGDLCKTLNLHPEEVSRKAGHILDLILNDFSRFSIGTIDSFFQLIIRAFTRETNLQGSYSLELDNREILAEAADNLLYELDKNEALRHWLTQYAEEIIQAGHNLNLTKEIINLGNELFRENFKILSKEYKSEIPEDEKIKEYTRLIRRIKYSFQKKMKEYGENFLKTSRNYGLEYDHFKGGSKSFANYFNKIYYQAKPGWFIVTESVKKAIDNPDEWYTKKSEIKDLILRAYKGGLNDILKDTIDYGESNVREYLTALTIEKFTYAFGILFDLSRHIRQILRERNLFLISDSAQFLHEIIGQNDTPFIYEKAGIYYKNFMLDEFQDTSEYQWGNFKPLISNSLAQGYDNLVVGDVKQSIYRWRNTDWNILDSGIENAFPAYYKEKSLNENWRSRKNIMLFNNQVFNVCPEIVRQEFLSSLEEDVYLKEEMIRLSGKISSAYKDTEQILPERQNREGGFVRLRFLPAGLNKADILDEIQRQLPETIRELQDRDYRAGDIGILVRNRKDGKKVATILLDQKKELPPGNRKYNFNVISNDSLIVSNNAAVQFLIALLRQIKDNEDNLNEAFLIHEYTRYIRKGNEEPEDPHFIFEQSLRNRCQSFNKVYSVYQQELGIILHLSLYELVEQMINIFHLNENSGDIPYLQAFQDIILAFMQKESSDISSFIKLWDETGNTETLNISEQQDAITIMTVHKAKGLEFKIVIIPFCDWHLDHEQRNIINVLWCETKTKPFDFLPFVPVNYSSKLSETYFDREYQTERIHAFVDNLNLLYVAFTRAKEELYIYSSPSDKKYQKMVNMGDVLYKTLDKLSDSSKLELNKMNDQGSLICEFGQPCKSIFNKEKKTESEIFKYYPVSTLSENLKIRYHGSEYFSTDMKKPGSIEYGIIMHEILSRVKVREDLPLSVERTFNEGKIELSDKEEIINAFAEGFSKAIPPEMFEPGWKIFTERDILTPEGDYRPDRLMFKDSHAIIIDYKFGAEVRSGYVSQVKNYIKWIKQTGYDHVKAYVWYFSLGKVEEITDER